jgi:hypothetical protein
LCESRNALERLVAELCDDALPDVDGGDDDDGEDDEHDEHDFLHTDDGGEEPLAPAEQQEEVGAEHFTQMLSAALAKW